MQRHTNLEIMHGWNVRLSSNYFLKTKCTCGTTNSTIHLVYCPHNAILFPVDTIALNLKMKQLRTHSPLREIFLGILTQITPPPWGPQSAQLESARIEQEELGSGSVWLCFMVQRWVDIQQDIYRERREPKELIGGRWVKNMLREIFNFVTVL